MEYDFEAVIFNFREQTPDFIKLAVNPNAFNQTDIEYDKKTGLEKSFFNFLYILKENDIKTILILNNNYYSEISKNSFLINLISICIDEDNEMFLNKDIETCNNIYSKICELAEIDSFNSVMFETSNLGLNLAQEANIGLIIGLSSNENSNSLKTHGADLVVYNFDDINIQSINTWFCNGFEEDAWVIKFHDFSPEQQYYRENIMSLGNGFLGNRSNFCFEKASEYHFPGTYMSGVYNELNFIFNGENVSQNELVNCPNWVYTNFKINDEDWFKLQDVKIVDFERRLDLKKGILSGWFLIEDSKNRQSMIEVVRCISLKNKNLAGLEFSITPLNYSGKISIKTSLDANVTNYINTNCVQKNRSHLLKPELHQTENIISLKTKTSQSNVEIKLSAIINSNIESAELIFEKDEWEISGIFSCNLIENQDFVVYKNIIYSNSLEDKSINHQKLLKDNFHFSIMANESAKIWESLWKIFDIEIKGNRKLQKAVRLNIYQLIISTYFQKNSNIFLGLSAGGLQSEVENGLINGDEVFVYPFFNISMPEISVALLKHRHKGLENAKQIAKTLGCEGARFPNITNNTGIELSQNFYLDETKKSLQKNELSKQNYVSLEIAMSIIRYYQATNDKDFMQNFGAEMLIEICKYYVSECKYSARDFKYHTYNFLNRDEYHTDNVKDNAYINIMLSWLLRRFLNIWHKQNYLFDYISNKPSDKEFDKWRIISQNLSVNVNEDGIIEQFSGYFNLKELDWVNYKMKYYNLQNIYDILVSEGRNVQEYKISSNIDLPMIFYNLNDKEIAETFAGLGIELNDDFKAKNFYYYTNRTLYSNLSGKILTAYIANSVELKDLCNNLIHEIFKYNFSKSYNLSHYKGAKISDNAMILMLLFNIYFGIDFKDRVLSIKPAIPHSWHQAKLNFLFRDCQFKFVFTPDSFNVKTDKDIGLTIYNSPCIIEKGEWWNIDL